MAIAVRSDVDLLRAALRGFHMLEDPQAWLKRPKNLAKVMGYWAKGRARNAAAYRPKGGPEREEMLTRLGLSPELDIQRVSATGCWLRPADPPKLPGSSRSERPSDAAFPSALFLSLSLAGVRARRRHDREG